MGAVLRGGFIPLAAAASSGSRGRLPNQFWRQPITHVEEMLLKAVYQRGEAVFEELPSAIQPDLMKWFS